MSNAEEREKPDKTGHGRFPQGGRRGAAVALAGGKSVVAAAGSVGVNEQTVRRWNKNPKFRARVNCAARGDDRHRRRAC